MEQKDELMLTGLSFLFEICAKALVGKIKRKK